MHAPQHERTEPEGRHVWAGSSRDNRLSRWSVTLETGTRSTGGNGEGFGALTAALLSSALLCSLVVGCGPSEEGVAEVEPLATVSASDAETTEPLRVPLGTKTPPPRDTAQERCQSAQEVHRPKNDEVLVYFGCVTTPTPDVFYAFARPVDPAASLGARLNTAVAAYFAGPSRQEGTNYFAFAGPEALNSTEVVGTRAVIDLNLDTLDSFTSAENAHIWNALRLLAFQFPSITEMEPRWNGSCESFGAAMEAIECTIALRNGQSEPGP